MIRPGRADSTEPPSAGGSAHLEQILVLAEGRRHVVLATMVTGAGSVPLHPAALPAGERSQPGSTVPIVSSTSVP